MRAAAVLALAFAMPSAHAEDARRAESPEGARSAQPPESPARREWTLELGGRVFVRDTLSRVDVGETVWRHDRAIDQARVSAVYERKRLRLAMEVDFAGDDANLKDTYIRVEPVEALRIRAGRFKVPMSFLGLESKWRLPSMERGLLSEFQLDDRDLPFVGARGEGLSVELRPDLPLEPRLTAALFQSPLASGLTPIDPSEELTQDLYLRAEIAPLADIQLAAGFALVGYNDRLGRADTFRHLALGSLELHADTRYLRVWLEAFAGQSFVYPAAGELSGSFWAVRGLVSPRLRRPFPGLFRLEPYAAGSVLDSSDDVSGDRVSEIGAGVNLAFTRHWRVQLEAVQRVAEGGASPVADTTLVRLQLGAAFAEIVAER